MNATEAIEVVRAALQQRRHLKNSEIVSLVGGDLQIVDLVRESLIFDEMARDHHGVGLVLIESALAGTTISVSDGVPLRSLRHRDDVIPSEDLAEGSPSESRLPLHDEAGLGTASTATSSQTVEVPDCAGKGRAPGDGKDWHARSADGSCYGPLGLEEMLGRLRAGKIPRDAVFRKGLSGAWVRQQDLARAIVSAAVRPTASESGLPSATVKTVEVKSVPRDTASSSAAQSEPQGAFYLWENGYEAGPLSSADIRARLDDSRLQITDFVRSGLDGNWVPVSQLFDASPPAAELAPPVSENPLAIDRPMDAALVNPPRALTAGRSTPVAINKVERVANKSDPAVAPPPLRSQRVKYWTPELDDSRFSLTAWVQRSKGWLIAVGTGLLVLAAVWYWPVSESAVKTDYMEVWTHIQSLANNRTSTEEWRAFCRRHRGRIARTVGRLERTASGARLVQLELLFAGKSGLLPLLAQTEPGLPDELREAFLSHMRLADHYAEGGEPWELAADQADSTADAAETTDAKPNEMRVLRDGTRILPTSVPPGAAGHHFSYDPRRDRPQK